MASSPGSGSGQQRISHPMFTVGPWDIHQLGPNSLKNNQMYGSFTYISSIVVKIPLKGETSIGVDLVGYGSKTTALQEGKVNFLFGCPTYAGTKTQPSLLIGKLGVLGYGPVAKMEEIMTPGQRDSLARTLHVVLCHTDYHNTDRHVRVPGESPLLPP
ncbi:hypothetical protein PGT21_018808 [Puccinia graminis f. sp. tritici]|uniref:Uncharacterized protein n=1 Tax=Puccinia graminis f. sp. tritici TaxID=56615 RepID=A0A5B0PGM0_PUCGR|nr:hypothetical protein PGT21_018808 [Puccinia graminis f. sp. tritici]